MAISNQNKFTLFLIKQLYHYRALNLWLFLLSVFSMVIALYMQYQMDLAPCLLCHFQRASVILMGVTAVVAFVHNPAYRGKIAYSLLSLVWALLGISTAARHIWIQNLPDHAVPACGPDLFYMLERFPMFETLSTVWHGSGDCHSISWLLWGISLPEYVLLLLMLYIFIYGWILLKVKKLH